MRSRQIIQVFFIAAFCAITSVAVLYSVLKKELKKTAVVDAVKLSNHYKMKVELEEREAVQLKGLGRTADSLKQSFQLAQKMNAGEPVLRALDQAFRIAAINLEQQYEQSNQEINEQVWKRLNPLVDEYARQNGYHLIIGANGMGSVLYNDDFYDITEQVISFVNRRYEQGE